jgi:hypothetical protein
MEFWLHTSSLQLATQPPLCIKMVSFWIEPHLATLYGCEMGRQGNGSEGKGREGERREGKGREGRAGQLFQIDAAWPPNHVTPQHRPCKATQGRPHHSQTVTTGFIEWRSSLHENPMLIAVSCLSPVSTQILIPAFASVLIVFGTSSCSLSSMAVAPSRKRFFSMSSACQ